MIFSSDYFMKMESETKQYIHQNWDIGVKNLWKYCLKSLEQLRFDYLVSFFETLFSQIMYCLCAKIHRRWRPFKIGDTRLIFAEKIHDGVFRLQSPTVPITLPNLRQTYQKFGKRHLAPRQLSGKLRFQTKILIATLVIFSCLSIADMKSSYFDWYVF